jgi:hypothetical protein
MSPLTGLWQQPAIAGAERTPVAGPFFLNLRAAALNLGRTSVNPTFSLPLTIA